MSVKYGRVFSKCKDQIEIALEYIFCLQAAQQADALRDAEERGNRSDMLRKQRAAVSGDFKIDIFY